MGLLYLLTFAFFIYMIFVQLVLLYVVFPRLYLATDCLDISASFFVHSSIVPSDICRTAVTSNVIQAILWSCKY